MGTKSGLAGFDRREFIGAAVATAVVPSMSLIPASQAAAVTGPALVSDWTIDDQWTGYPRYAEAIGCGRPRALAERPKADPADEIFIPV